MYHVMISVSCCNKVLMENFDGQISRQGYYTQKEGVLKNGAQVYEKTTNADDEVVEHH